jgi:hypothetical protein
LAGFIDICQDWYNYIFAELESQTDRDALSKQQEEVNSFPPDA